MAIKDWFRGRGEAAHLSNLKISAEFLDAEYEIHSEDLVRGDTRLLKVFSLIPKVPAKPSFHARVDDGSSAKRKDPELDIDITGVTRATARDFKACRNGYCGHHNDRSPTPDERIFDVTISTPTGKVFEGQVSFNVTFSQALPTISVSSTACVETKVIRAGSNKET